MSAYLVVKATMAAPAARNPPAPAAPNMACDIGDRPPTLVANRSNVFRPTMKLAFHARKGFASNTRAVALPAS